jgi:hypothetical protein
MLGIFKNRVLRRIFWLNKGEATGKWRRLRIRSLRWAGYIACLDERREACRVLVGKTCGKEAT